jgi:hypothetical protein
MAGWLGSFSADGNGNLTGELDEVMLELDSYGLITGPESFTGTYCVTSDNLGTMTISSNAGTKVLAFSLSSDGNGYVISFDASQESNNDLFPLSFYGNQGSGLLRKQQTTTFSTDMLKGSFAFGLVGVEGNEVGSFPGRHAMVGVVTLDGNGNICSSGITCEFDSTDFYDGVATETLSASTYSVASNGRGTATLTAAGVGTINLVFYIVSPSEMLAMTLPSGPQPLNPMNLGEMLATSGTFSNAALNGVSVIGTQGLDGGTTPEAQLGVIATNGNGSFTESLDEDYGGTVTSATVTGNYSVAPNGRVTLANVVGGGINPILYLVGPNEAFILGTSLAVDFGMLQPQTGSNFTSASLMGTFVGGSEPAVSFCWHEASCVSQEVDSVSFDGNGSISETSDQVNDEGSLSVYWPGGENNELSSSNAVNGTYTASASGRIVVNGQGGEQEAILYIISTSQLIAMSLGNANPYLVDFKQ